MHGQQVSVEASNEKKGVHTYVCECDKMQYRGGNLSGLLALRPVGGVSPDLFSGH